MGVHALHSSSHNLRIPSQTAIRQEDEIKGIQIGKEVNPHLQMA
jgi:hypothetical protein